MSNMVDHGNYIQIMKISNFETRQDESLVKIHNNLKNVKFEGDTLVELQKFWTALNTAFTSTLNANKGLGDYDKLQSIFYASDVLVPPLGHTQKNQAMCAYENYKRVLRDHLLKKDTTDKETSPKAFRTLTKNQLNKDGFDILNNIIIKGSSQLGGDERDLVNYMKELKIQDGEKLVEFYHRAKTMEYEIELQQDQTGQLKRLSRMFLQQLQVIPTYKQELGYISKGIKIFFQKSYGYTILYHTV